MKTLAQDFKKTSRKEQYVGYHLNEERRDNANIMFADLYTLANRYEEQRVYQFEALTVDKKLDEIITEIKIRVRITKQEIFRIGELLFLAKNLCQTSGQGFKEWIENNFDFSYETGINFMHVYQYCVGYRSLAVEVPTTILYRVSMPSFPDELRDFLFKEGHLEKLSMGKLQALKRIHDKEGMEAVMEKVEGINKWVRVLTQVKYNFDLYENALRILEDYKSKLEKGNMKYWNKNRDEYKVFISSHEKEAQEINLTLYKALVHSIEILQKAFTDCHKQADEIQNNLNDKM